MRLVTRWSPQEIETIEKDVASGTLHPRDAKMKMSSEITSIFYGEEDAKSAQENFKMCIRDRCCGWQLWA